MYPLFPPFSSLFLLYMNVFLFLARLPHTIPAYKHNIRKDCKSTCLFNIGVRARNGASEAERANAKRTDADARARE